MNSSFVPLDLVWPLNALNDGFPNAYAGYASRTSYPGYTPYGYPYAGNYYIFASIERMT